VSRDETAGSIEMAFGLSGAVGPSNHVLHGGSGSTHGKGQFWGISSLIEKHWDCMLPCVQRHVSPNRERCTTSVTCFPARMWRMHVNVRLLPI